MDEIIALAETLPHRDAVAGEYEIGACLRALIELYRRPDVPSRLADALSRAAGINDQEDDDNVLWRALTALGITRGPQLRVLSQPKDDGPTPALKDAMWRGLGPVIRYDLDARGPADQRARAEYVAALRRWSAGAELVTLIVTAPLGDHGLLPAIVDGLELAARDQQLLVVFYSGQYNVRRAHRDISAVTERERARVIDISRYSFFRGLETVTDNMWRVRTACPGFAPLCERVNPELAQRTRAFRAHFNRELLRPTLVFDRSAAVAPPVRARAERLWDEAEAAPPDRRLERFAAYRRHLATPELLALLKPWKRSTVIGYERDAPIADACVALLALLLRKAPDELELTRGDWRYNGRFSEVIPRASAAASAPAIGVTLRAPRRWIFEVFIGLLAAARCLRGQLSEGS